jgi:basic amino acid/polyamine antiporter, APA family
MESPHLQPAAVEPRLGLWDAISIIVGIIIGVGIFAVPGEIFEKAPGPWEALGVWALAGVLPLIGAFCFAELASTYPRSGGEYVYLTRAFGSKLGFLYAWAQFAVIRPASIALVAYVFAEYAGKLLGSAPSVAVAVAAIALLTLINILGVVLGKQTQNLLTAVKVLGLGAIVVVGFLWADPNRVIVRGIEAKDDWLIPALIASLWTYAGWHEAAYVAAEVKNSRRNLPLALILGTVAVTIIYLLINAALLAGLGFDAARKSHVLAVDLLDSVWPSAGVVISVLVMISALGGINGMTFTTGRLYAAFGEEHRLFSPLSRWSRRWQTPARALAVQGVVSIAFVIGAVWWASNPVNPGVSAAVGAAVAPASQNDPFATLLYGTAVVFWLTFFLTGIALFVLRKKDAGIPRPFPVPFYPWLPLVFCACCGALAVGAVLSKREESLISLGILLAGLPFLFLSGQKKVHTPLERETETIMAENSPLRRY